MKCYESDGLDGNESEQAIERTKFRKCVCRRRKEREHKVNHGLEDGSITLGNCKKKESEFAKRMSEQKRFLEI